MCQGEKSPVCTGEATDSLGADSLGTVALRTVFMKITT